MIGYNKTIVLNGDTMTKHRLLTATEETALFRKYQNNNDREAYERLFESQVRFAKLLIFKRFKSFKFLQDDLVAEAYLSIDKAIKTFNIELGCRLTTLVGRIVSNDVKKYIRKNCHAINMPVNAPLPGWTVENQKDLLSYDYQYGVEHKIPLDVSLSGLTQHENIVVKELFFNNKTIKQLSKELQVTTQAVSSAKLSALKKLKKSNC